MSKSMTNVGGARAAAGDATRADVPELFEQLAARVADPRALEIPERERQAFDEACQRAERQLIGELPPVLIVALAGGTGVGKSTLINGLAGAPIAEAGQARPTTTQIVVYHHREVPLGGLPSELTYGARFVAHEREELRFKVLVDTPDLDSFVREHRERTLDLLQAAGLVLYVFSPEKYLEERIWSVLRAEREFSATAAVLNKADTLHADELERVTVDLGQRLAGCGLGSIRIFRTQAARHTGSADSADPGAALPGARSEIDDLPDLRAFLERELREGDATRIVRESRRRMLAKLRAAVEGLSPAGSSAGARAPGAGVLATVEQQLDALEARVGSCAVEAGSRLVDVIGPELAAIEEELAPLATLRQHERFRGPFRAWLAFADFLTIGLAGLVDRLVGRPSRGTADVVDRIFGQARAREVDGLLREEERRLQDALFDSGLPVARWRAVAGETGGAQLLELLSGAVRERFEARSAVASARGGACVWTISAIGGLVPAVAIFGGLWLVVRDLFAGNYLGPGLVLHLLAVVLLFFLALHAIVAVLLPTTGRLGKGLGLAAASEVLPRLFDDWVARYRTDVESDVRELLAPLEQLERLLADELGDGDPGAAHEALSWPDPETAPRGSAPGERARPATERTPGATPDTLVDPAERMLRALERE